MTRIPDYVRGVLNTLEAGGYTACLVGGCLRDMLLGRNIHDWDVATSALGSDVASLFQKTIDTGARYGTVTVLTGGGFVEVTTFRSDGVYSDCRRPDDVTFVDDLQEDLKRRDFTINAMAMTGAGSLFDPFDGQGDLMRRLIRCVGNAEDRFTEDALRMFRALRFSAQLGFDIEIGTLEAIKKCAPLCAALSAERVRDETEKILMSGRPELAAMAVEYGLYEGRLERKGLQSEKLRRIAELPHDRQLRWAAFCAVLLHSGLITSAEAFLNAMRLDTKTVRHAAAGTSAVLGAPNGVPLPTDWPGLKRLMADIGVEAAFCASAADDVMKGGNAVQTIDEIISSGECYSFRDLAVTGDDLIALGVMPGIHLGRLLKTLLEHVINHPEDNKRELLMNLAAKIMQ